MGKQQNKRNLAERLEELLREIDRLLNPHRPVPVRVPARVRQR